MLNSGERRAYLVEEGGVGRNLTGHATKLNASSEPKANQSQPHFHRQHIQTTQTVKSN